MFEINKYKYVDVNTRSKFEVYSRTLEFADKLIDRINNLGTFTLRKAKVGFCKKMTSEIPPYNVEQEQEETVRKWEENANDKEKKIKNLLLCRNV